MHELAMGSFEVVLYLLSCFANLEDVALALKLGLLAEFAWECRSSLSIGHRALSVQGLLVQGAY
jgi:hypothetical protein